MLRVMGVDSELRGPAGHIEVVRRQGPADPRLWRRRGIQIALGLGLIALSAWWVGAIATNAIIIVVAIALALIPANRDRMHNAVDAARREAWVSPPAHLDDKPTVLMVIDDRGVELVNGRRLAAAEPLRELWWSEITSITLDGPAGRPNSVTINPGDADVTVTGPFPGSLLDRLSALGAVIPPLNGPAG
jgi:hypothetical protein